MMLMVGNNLKTVSRKPRVDRKRIYTTYTAI